MGVVCGTCGETNRDGSRFCASCGTRTVARCATCDADLADGSRFCDACGAPVLSAQSATDEPSRQTRKVVTVLFGDLVGSTALQERMDPESVRGLMGRCYSVLRECVERHGGRVVKFVGDGTMAVFGVPDVAQDDATRALAAGAEMVAAIEALASGPGEVGAGLTLRVGINTGEVVVDEDDPDVVGDVVNVAARLEGAAAPGAVLVSGTTWRLTRDGARFAPAELVAIRGRTDPVTAHPLVAMGAEPAADASPTGFVGRDAELGTLLGALEAATTARELRLVSIIGSPGVGKSRLGRELESRIGERAAVVRTGCVAGGGAALAPIAELLDGLAALGAVEDTRDDSERAAVVRRGLAAGEAAPPEELFWTVRRAVEATASNTPLVLLLEDLHWAEPLLLDLVEHLAEWVRDVPVLLVAVARPELREIRPSLAVPRRASQQLLTLEGLDREATEDLARELLGVREVPAALLARLGPSTDGNPLFVRELIRMLVDDGILERAGDAWSLTVAADSVEVPPTIQALLAARIDQLGDGERTVLERAAVIGADVYRGALDALLPPELAGRLDELLEGLRRKELLEPAGTYWIDERVLRFHHALIRDAAYARLLRNTRARLHERTARWLAEKTGGGPDHDEAVGFHLEQAQACHRALGPLDDDARRVATEAATRLSSAAARALDRDDLSAAASLAGRAIACLEPGDPDRADLLITQGEALLGEGQVVAAGPIIDELGELAPGDARLSAWLTCFTWQRIAMVDPGGLDDLGPALTAAADELTALGDLVGAAKAYRVHASVLARLGRVGDCEAALDRALSAARASSDRRQITSVLTAAPTVALWGPSPVPRAGGRCLDVIRLVRITTGARVVEATSIRSQAVLESFRGRFEAARSMIGGARHIAEEIGSRNALMEVELSAGTVELGAGDLDAAMDHLRRAQEGFTAMGVGADAAQAASLRARAALRLGRPDDALAFVAESEQLSRQDLKSSILRKVVRAEVLAERGELTEALALAEEAVALAERTDALVDHADACAALAAVRRAAGDSAGAAAAAAEARGLYELKGATALATGVDERGTDASLTLPDRSAREIAPVSNAASRQLVRILELVVQERFDEIATLVTPDLVHDDVRPGLGSRYESLGATIENLMTTTDLGIRSIDTEVLAVRGERQALVSSVWRGDFEVSLVSMVQLDADGRVGSVTTFAPEALADAVQLLDEQYLAGEAAAVQHWMRRPLIDLQVLLAAQDWEGLRSLYSPGIAYIDHTSAGFGEVRGYDEMIAYHQAMLEIVPSHRRMIREIPAVGDHCSLSVLVTGTLDAADPNGGHQIVSWMVSVIAEDGRIQRSERFGPDQVDAAWALFRDLEAARSAPVEGARAELEARAQAPEPAAPTSAAVDAPSNTTSTNGALENLRAAVAGIVSNDRDRVRSLFAPDCTFEDRRPGLATVVEGVDAMVDQLLLLRTLGVEHVEAEGVELRGDRAALVRTHWVGRFDVVALFVNVIDERGRSTVSLTFEEDQLDEARAELEKHHRALTSGEPTNTAAQNLHILPAPTNAALRTMAALSRAVAAGEVGRLPELLSTDVVSEDRRRGLSMVVAGRDAVVASLAQLSPLGVDRADFEPLILRGERLVLGRLLLGGPRFETMALALGEVDDEGRGICSILWELDQLEDATIEIEERFHAGEGAEHAEWLSRVSPTSLLAHARRDWPALRACYAPDVELQDHRRLSRNTARGPEGALSYVTLMVELDPTHHQLMRRYITVADHVMLTELVSGGTGSAAEQGATEVVNLLVTAHDAQGRIAQMERFEHDDLPAARARFDELVAQGHPQTTAERCMRRDDAAFMAADWDALEWIWDDDVVSDDRRRLVGAGLSDRIELFVALHFLVDSFGPSSDVHTEVLGRSGEDHIASRSVWRGKDVELEVLFVATVSELGRIRRVTFFDPDQVDEALIELAARGRTPEPLTTAAQRAQRAVFEAAAAGDGGRLHELVAPNALSEDRRPGLGAVIDGRDAVVANLLQVHAVGVEQVDIEPLVLRGERLVLSRVRFRGAQFETEALGLEEVDDGGRSIGTTAWEPNQLDDALIEIERRYHAGEGAAFASWLPVSMPAVLLAHRRRDWDALRSLYAPDIQIVDHRPMAHAGIRGIDAAIEYHQVMVDLEPTHQLVIRRRLAIGDHVLVAEMVSGGRGDDDPAGPYEVLTLMVSTHDAAGRTATIELYSLEDEAAALARFEELVAQGQPQTMAERCAHRANAALLAKDWDALEHLYADDAIGDDRRRTMGIGVSNRETMFEVFGFVIEERGGLEATQLTVIGRSGEHTVACRALWSGGGAELEMIFVTTVNEEGRCTKVVFFDHEADALAELTS